MISSPIFAYVGALSASVVLLPELWEFSDEVEDAELLELLVFLSSPKLAITIKAITTVIPIFQPFAID